MERNKGIRDKRWKGRDMRIVGAEREREKDNQRNRHEIKRGTETTACSDPLPGQQLVLKTAACPPIPAEWASPA